MMPGKDRDEEKESISPKKVRRELILYMLRKYGNLQTKEISKVLGHEPRTIRRTLKKLEDSGKVVGDKLGRSYVWASTEEKKDEMMYF